MESADDKDRDNLERSLQAIRFEPRASLWAEVAGRLRAPEASPPRARPRWPGLRWAAAAILLALAAVAGWIVSARWQRLVVVDRCCQDLDGGGVADDGLVVVSRSGGKVEELTVYEDRDGSRSFTAGDIVRFRRHGALALSRPVGEDSRTVEYCCLDYDGGGPSDDALLVVGRPPDLISMAAIYEHSVPTGGSFPLR